MEDIISEISQAEQNAEQILANARKTARDVIAQAEQKQSEIFADNKAAITAMREEKFSVASAEADKVYAQCLSEGAKEGRAAQANAESEIEGLAKEVVGRFLDGYR